MRERGRRHSKQAAGLTIASVFLLAACAGGSPPSQKTPATDVRTTGSTAFDPGGREVLDETAEARSAAKALASSETVRVEGLAGVLARLPRQLQGRTGITTESGISYPSGAGSAIIEAMERVDVYGPKASETDQTAQGLLDRLVRDQGIQVMARCEGSGVLCVAGNSSENRAVAVWLSPDSDLIFAAIAANMNEVRALADAWRDASR